MGFGGSAGAMNSRIKDNARLRNRNKHKRSFNQRNDGSGSYRIRIPQKQLSYEEVMERRQLIKKINQGRKRIIILSLVITPIALTLLGIGLHHLISFLAEHPHFW